MLARDETLADHSHAEMGLDERFNTWVEQWPHDIAAVGTSADQLRADHARHGPRWSPPAGG